MVIVAIGESIVAIGIGAAGLPVDLALASVAVLGLLLAACLWWAYFGGDDDTRAEHALAVVPDDRRGWVAINVSATPEAAPRRIRNVLRIIREPFRLYLPPTTGWDR